MDEEYQMHQLLGLVHYREKRKTVDEERDAYKNALQRILRVTTVAEALMIASMVLEENRK